MKEFAKAICHRREVVGFLLEAELDRRRCHFAFVSTAALCVSFAFSSTSTRAMRRFIAVAMLLAPALGWPAHAEVLIGVAGALTGQLAWTGSQIQRGAEMAVADINAAGGVLGQQIKIIVADCAVDRVFVLAA